MHDRQRHSQHESTPALQRLGGIGLIAVSVLVVLVVMFMLDDINGTPYEVARPIFLAICGFCIFIGVALGFPELLPRSVVAITMLGLGSVGMLAGALMLLLALYNLLVERQLDFVPVGKSLPIVLIGGGFALAARGWATLRKSNDNDTKFG